MKIFISQSMKGKTNDEILNRREYIKEFANDICLFYTNESIEFLETFFDNKYNNDEPLINLGEAIKMMHDADIVIFDKGWEYSNGCVVEHECAVRYGKDILYI